MISVHGIFGGVLIFILFQFPIFWGSFLKKKDSTLASLIRDDCSQRDAQRRVDYLPTHIQRALME